MPAANAQFSAVGDFSTVSNPNGNWRYGQTRTLGSAFSLFTIVNSDTQTTGWFGSRTTPFGNFPYVYKNITGATIIRGATTQPVDLLVMHPSDDGTLSVVRFVAPTSGTFNITGRFAAVTNDSTDVHVLVNSISVFDSSITQGNANPDPATANRSPFNLIRTLSAGDTVDFAVGYGSDGNYGADATGFAASISTSTAPEASPFALLALGGFVRGIVAARRKIIVR